MIRIICLFVLFIALTSCNKADSSISIIIEGIVLNARTSETMEGAKVEIFTNSKSYIATTDENGYFSLGKFPIGDYSLIISKEGYSTDLRQIFASQELLIYDVGFEMVKSYVFNLFPLDEKLELTLLRRVQNGLPVPAANFPFKIRTGDINAVVEGTSDQNGLISLDNMPLVFNLIINHEYNNFQYRYSSQVYLEDRNYVILNASTVDTYFGIASANILDENGVPRNDFVTTSPIELTFTVPIDTINSVISFLEYGWNDVNVNFKWTNSNTKLSVTPDVSLNPFTNYIIGLELIAENTDQFYSAYIEFYTAE